MSTSHASGSSAANSPVVRRRVLHVGSVGMIVGGLISVVGSLLPWVSTPLGSLSGTAGPGLWTMSMGFLAIAGALLPYRRVALAHALGPGIVIALIVGWQAVRLIDLSASTGSWGQLLPGMGLVMVAGGAVILLAAGYRIWSTA